MKKKAKDAISVLYRVQGGRGDKKSRKYITVENGEINTEKLKQDSTLYIGNSQHMVHFLRKRLGIRGSIVSHITNPMDLQELSERDVEVVRMYVPEWFKYVLSATAVGERNTRLGLPKLVDKTTPGDSFGISRLVGKIIRRFLLLRRKYTS